MLFGEHSVLIGSEALAFPFRKYYMKWINSESEQHPERLRKYVAYLAEHCNDFLDIDQLNLWTKDHTIEANIPIGYGLGSSGALTAAIYDLFVKNKDDQRDITKKLGLMESFFHGQSSGSRFDFRRSRR